MSRDRRREALLLDYYGILLTDHQRSVLEEYFNEDLSMNEIADNLEISKSAVADLVKRSVKQLEEYESKLKLIYKNDRIEQILAEFEDEKDDRIVGLIDRIRENI